MYQRHFNPLLSNSFFLFGGRGTGKTSALRSLLPPGPSCLWFDLLDEGLFLSLSAHPARFEEMIPRSFDQTCWVVADEIQRAPGLLNYVHRLIEQRGIRFALTGSSARKLRRGGANLLAGRAWLNHLHPLTHLELGNAFDLDHVLRWGTLPRVAALSDEVERKEFLKVYAQTYVRQEIKEEQTVRRLDPFLRFLEVAAQCNGEILNHSKIARDVGSDPKGVERYFEILDDTLLGVHLEPFHASVRKRQTRRSKFYFFDLGVTRALTHQLDAELSPRTFAYGRAFEHFFILECMRLRDYRRRDEQFFYLRTKDDLEIDLIIERGGSKRTLIEIKSSNNVDATELTHQRKLARDLAPCDFWVASNERQARSIDGVEILPWREVLTRLYGSEI